MNGTKKVAIISDAASTGRVSLEIGIPLFFSQSHGLQEC